MRTIRLALRLLRRDWRAGELRVLAAALVLAVASVGTVGLFADRVKAAMTTQANLLLGARPDDFGRSRAARVVHRQCAAARTGDDAGHPLQQHGAAAAGCGLRCPRRAVRRQGGRRRLSVARRHHAGRSGAAGWARHDGDSRRAAKHGRIRGSPRGWVSKSATASPSANRCSPCRRSSSRSRKSRASSSRSVPSCCSTSTTCPPPTCCSRAIARRGACWWPIARARRRSMRTASGSAPR